MDNNKILNSSENGTRVCLTDRHLAIQYITQAIRICAYKEWLEICDLSQICTDFSQIDIALESTYIHTYTYLLLLLYKTSLSVFYVILKIVKIMFHIIWLALMFSCLVYCFSDLKAKSLELIMYFYLSN